MKFLSALICSIALTSSQSPEPVVLKFTSRTSYPRSITVLKGTIVHLIGPVTNDQKTVFILRADNENRDRGSFTKDWKLTWDSSKETKPKRDLIISWAFEGGRETQMARIAVQILDKSPFELSSSPLTSIGSLPIAITHEGGFRAEKYDIFVDDKVIGLILGPDGSGTISPTFLPPGSRKIGGRAVLAGGGQLDIASLMVDIPSQITLPGFESGRVFDLEKEPNTKPSVVRFVAASGIEPKDVELWIDGQKVQETGVAPFDDLTIDPKGLKSGTHLFRIEILDKSGRRYRSIDTRFAVRRNAAADQADAFKEWLTNWNSQADGAGIPLRSVEGSWNPVKWEQGSRELMRASEAIKTIPPPTDLSATDQQTFSKAVAMRSASYNHLSRALYEYLGVLSQRKENHYDNQPAQIDREARILKGKVIVQRSLDEGMREFEEADKLVAALAKAISVKVPNVEASPFTKALRSVQQMLSAEILANSVTEWVSFVSQQVLALTQYAEMLEGQLSGTSAVAATNTYNSILGRFTSANGGGPDVGGRGSALDGGEGLFVTRKEAAERKSGFGFPPDDISTRDRSALLEGLERINYSLRYLALAYDIKKDIAGTRSLADKESLNRKLMNALSSVNGNWSEARGFVQLVLERLGVRRSHISLFGMNEQ